MNRRITLSGLLCIFLLAGFSGNAQNYSLIKADSLFACGSDSAALLNYEGCFFYAETVDDRTVALIKKSQVYKKMMLFDQASYTLERSLKIYPSSEKKKTVFYELALNQYLGGNFYDALKSVDSLKKHDSQLSKEALLIEILALNECGEYARSSLLATEYVNLFVPDSIKGTVLTAVKNHWNENNFPRLKNAKTAVVLSRIVPGAGQIYAGYAAEGIFNFLVHVVCLGYGVYEIWNGFYFTGYMAGFSLFSKFYFGAPGRVKFLVKKTNYQKTKSFNDSAVEILLGK